MESAARKSPTVIYLPRPRTSGPEPVGTEGEDAALEVIATAARQRAAARRSLALALAASLALHLVIFSVGFGYLTPPVIHHPYEAPKPLEVTLPQPLPKTAEPAAVPPAPKPKEPRPRKPQPAPAPVMTAPLPVPESAPTVALPPEATPVPVAPQPAPAASPVPSAIAPESGAAYLNNPPPAYPSSARRLGQQGLVLIEVYVNRAGKPELVQLARSSGVAALDEAALNAVKHWTFAPARRGAEAVDEWVEVPVRFRLEKGE